MGEHRISLHTGQLNRLAVDLREAAAMIGVCERTVKREIQRGKLRGLKVGRVWRVRVAAIEEYLEQQERAVQE